MWRTCLLVLVTWHIADALTVFDVQHTTTAGPQGTWPSLYTGQVVTLTGIVTATGYYENRWFLADSTGGPWSGLLIWDADNSVTVGDLVRVTGTVAEYYGHTELISVSSREILATDQALPPVELASCADLALEDWEGVLVELGPVEVISGQNNYGEWQVGDGAMIQVDDAFFNLADAGIAVAPGQQWQSITGIADYQNQARAINPRFPADLQSTSDGATISLPTAWLAVGETTQLPLGTTNLLAEWGLSSFSMSLHYDPQLTALTRVELDGTLSSGGELDLVENLAGEVEIAVVMADALVGSGNLLRLEFQGMGAGSCPLEIDSFAFNTGLAPARLDGLLELRNAYPRADTLTLVQLPLGTQPAFVGPGDTLTIWCESDPATSGWWVQLRLGGAALSPLWLNAQFDLSQEWWRLDALLPPDMPDGLWDLVVGNSTLEDFTRRAVNVVADPGQEFLFAQITDTHLPTHLFYDNPDSAADSASMEDLRAVIADLNLIHPAFVLLTGDLVNEGELEDLELRRVFSRSKDLLATLEVPLVLSAGNHDMGGWDATPEPDGTSRRDWWKFFGWSRLDDPPPGAPLRTQNGSFDYGPLHVTHMESWVNYENWRPEIYGATSFNAEQLAWLQQDLAASDAPYKILSTHYDFANQIDATASGLDLLLMGHIHSDSGDGAGPPWRLCTESVTDGGRAYRLVRVGAAGLDPRPTLRAGAAGERLRVAWSAPNDGTADSLEATIVNQQPEAFPAARLSFRLAPGLRDVSVTGGECLGVDYGVEATEVAVRVSLLASSQSNVRVRGERRPAAPTDLGIRVGAGQVHLLWLAVPGASAYRVESTPLPAPSWVDVSGQGEFAQTSWSCPMPPGPRLYRVVALVD